MKILAISKVKDGEVESAIDLWRVYRPLHELAKHVDWQIDWQSYPIRDIEAFDDPDTFMRTKAADEVKHLGQYDIIFTSYFTSPHAYTVLEFASRKYGTKVILDIDDDLHNVDYWNPAWLKAGKAGMHFLRRMGEVAPYISTTTQILATKLKNKSEVSPKVFINPNWIPDQYPECTPSNGNKIVIGYFGGSSHYRDLHSSGFLPALQRIVHENKNVYFKCVGQPVDYYIPKARCKVIEPVKGTDWPKKLFPTLNFDIAVAPLLDTPFSQSKSNIKWQEATRMGAAFIGSAVGPYKSLPGGTALVVNNAETEWYEALKKMLDADFRKDKATKARKALEAFRLEDNWQSYKSMIEEVYNDSSSDTSSR